MVIGSQIIQVLRQGIWASLTGGWFFDPRQTLFSNTIHVYLWLFLLTCPLILHICFAFTPAVIGIYGAITGLCFAAVKVAVWQLHRIFDIYESHEEEVPVPAGSGGGSKALAKRGRGNSEEVQSIPMEAINCLESGVDNLRADAGSDSVFRAPSLARMDTRSSTSGGEGDRAEPSGSSTVRGAEGSEDRTTLWLTSAASFPSFPTTVSLTTGAGIAEHPSMNPSSSRIVADLESSSGDESEEGARHSRGTSHKKSSKTTYGNLDGRAVVAGCRSKSHHARSSVSGAPAAMYTSVDIHHEPPCCSSVSSNDSNPDEDTAVVRALLGRRARTGAVGNNPRRSSLRYGVTYGHTTEESGDRQYGGCGSDHSSHDASNLAKSKSATAAIHHQPADPDLEPVEQGPLHQTPSESTLRKSSAPSVCHRSRRRRKVTDAPGKDVSNDDEDEAERSMISSRSLTDASYDCPIRRTKSTMEATSSAGGADGASRNRLDFGRHLADGSSSLLSENTLQECRRRARKSYPGGKSTSSVDIFLSSAWHDHIEATRGTLTIPSSNKAKHSLNSSSDERFSGLGVPSLPTAEVLGSQNGACSTVKHQAGSLPLSPTNSSKGHFCRFSSLEIPFPDIPERDSECEYGGGTLAPQNTKQSPKDRSSSEGSRRSSTLLHESMQESLRGHESSSAHVAKKHKRRPKDLPMGIECLSNDTIGRPSTGCTSEVKQGNDYWTPAASPSITPLEAAIKGDNNLGRSYEVHFQDYHSSGQSTLEGAKEVAGIYNATTGSSSLIQDLRQKLQTLKSESSITLSDETLRPQQSRSTSADKRRPSTPDLRWLFGNGEEVPFNSVSLRRSSHQNHCHEAAAVLSSADTDSSAQSILGAVPRVKANMAPGDLVSEVALDQCSRGVDNGQLDVVGGAGEGSSYVPDGDARAQLKEDIRRLLEEILVTHPEALEALESIREAMLNKNRPATESTGENISAWHLENNPELGADSARSLHPQLSRRSGAVRTRNPEGMRRHHRRRTQQPSATILPTHSSARPAAAVPSTTGFMALADLASRPGTHSATSHEDTSKGAVHCFQDEDGNWWAYTFDEGGAGIAQALGSSKAVMEMVSAGQDPIQGGRRQTDPLISGISQDPDPCYIPRPGSWLPSRDDAMQPDHHDDSSSSSVESFMPEVPSSVLHPATGSSIGLVEYPVSGANFRPSTQMPGTSLRRVPRRGRRVIGGEHHGGSANSSARLPLAWMMERTLAAAARNNPNQAYVSGPSASGLTGAGTDISGVLAVSSGSGYGPLSSNSLRAAESHDSGSPLNHIRFIQSLMPDNAGGDNSGARPVKRKHYYKIPLCGPLSKRTFKLRYDRLQLLALFDRNRFHLSAGVDVLLAILVSLLSAGMFARQYYHDIWLVIFCANIAAAQFSLLKSVQPDAASPIHGYNWLVSYSRSIYFILAACAIFAIDYALSPGIGQEGSGVEDGMSSYGLEPVYGVSVVTRGLLIALKTAFLCIILCFPIVFTIGLLPQINTFSLHILEQLDILIFGGTAAQSLASSLFAVCRSILCVAVLTCIGQFPLRLSAAVGSQQVLFAAYTAMLVVVSYLLSRSTSRVSLLCQNLLTCLGRCRRCHRGQDPGSPQVDEQESVDPLPRKLNETLVLRLKADVIASCFMFLIFFALHCSTVFKALNPMLTIVLAGITAPLGLVLHYVWPHFRKHTPWLLVAKPMLRSYEFGLFDDTEYAQRIMWFERLYAWFCCIERNLLYPLLVLSALTFNAETLLERFGPWGAAGLLSLAGVKILRTAYRNASQLYVPLVIALLFFRFDYPFLSESFIVDFYILAILYTKLIELILKLQFVFVYVAPWQITWGSAFHAFAQPFGVPHAAFLMAQTFVSSIVSAPLNPFLGSALFLMSYVRPVKFWEKDYNTRRVDNSNTRLVNQFDRGPTTDDNNLNSIFYEHLTRSLQVYLAGDILLGRWATPVCQGDCFILASYYLNCLVHIIEVGNGFITFQLRGLEFRGTYCQQREVEAISEDIVDSSACCCCEPGRLPGFLSFNTAWNLRWLAWEVTTSKYIVEGYSITDNSAASMLQVYELRKLLVSLYVKCITYYCLRSRKLDDWLCLEAVINAMSAIQNSASKYVDVDPVFNVQIDEDYDSRMSGISRSSFAGAYRGWIRYCLTKRGGTTAAGMGISDTDVDSSPVVSLCYALSLVGRRTLGVASHNGHKSVESFLYGLHSLFKGDFRITCARDEWVFADMDFLRSVISPAIRMALKLHQDHFTSPNEYDDDKALYDAISHYDETLFISHEGDPAWRHAVLANMQSLLALRHVLDDGSDEYKVIRLKRRYLSFRVIKLNRECVRGLWAGQQQELIFLRNRNPERGSIQNARQVLRNMINSSADQPIGYPIYVSPLTTSFVETNPQLRSITGPPFTLGTLRDWALCLFRRLREHCGMTCSSNISLPPQNPGLAPTVQSVPLFDTERRSGSTPVVMSFSPHQHSPAFVGSSTAPASLAYSSRSSRHGSSLPGSTPPRVQRSLTHPVRTRLSLSGLPIGPATTSGDRMTVPTARSSVIVSTTAKGAPARVHLATSSSGDPHRYSTASSGIDMEDVNITNERVVDDAFHAVKPPIGPLPTGPPATSLPRVRLIDLSHIFETLNKIGAHGISLVSWPSDEMRTRGGKQYWQEQSWSPQRGMEGHVVHKWMPCHADSSRRSHLDKIICLVKIGDKYVPIAEQGVQYVTTADSVLLECV